MNILYYLLVSIILLISSAAYAQPIKQIQIIGNARIETSTVIEYLKLDVGQEYSQYAKNEAIKNLYATSLFESVSIDFSSGTLVVNVKEMPLITKIVVNGNNKLKTNLIMNEIYTAVGESLNKDKVARDVEQIKSLYKKAGRFAVSVKSYIEKQANNRAKLVFEVLEGPKTGIKSINFVGNENYRSSELKSLILTKESRWFRFLESNDTYDAERIEADKYLLTKFYNSVGFADFRVISVAADMSPTKDGFSLTYCIDEGDKYNLGTVTVNNKIKDIDSAQLQKFLKFKKGAVFNLTSIENVADKMSDHLAAMGYPQADIDPDLKINRRTKEVDVVLVIDKAPKVFFNRINISGNLKTEDKVIRREMKISEGDLYSRPRIQKGERNIRNLDYFSKVHVSLTPTDKPDRYDINIDVEEKSTASVGFDVGYNSSDGPFGRVSFTERNLIGTGRYLNAGVQAGRKSLYSYFGLTDPHFADTDISLGGNVFKSDKGRGSGFDRAAMTYNKSSNYNQSSVGAKISMGYDIVEDLSHEIDYTIKQDKLSSPGDTPSALVLEQLGKYSTSAIGHGLTYNQLDSVVLPKNGYMLNGSQEYAGLGGNNKYLKHELEAKIFSSFIENKYTIKISASAGYIKGMHKHKVRISDRFNLGDYSLRGFENAGVGPRDKKTEEGLGGQKYYAGSLELNFPIGMPQEFNITGAAFIDAGALWDADTSRTISDFYNDKDLRSAAGIGLVWASRLGPIRVDIPLVWIKKKKYDSTLNYHVKFASHF